MFELIHLHKNLKRSERIRKEYCWYNMYVLKVVLIFSRNILLCTPKLSFLFPIEETIVRSIIPYSKLRPSLLSCLFYEPWLRCILNQSGSTKETVSLKIGENIAMLVCFICVGTQDRILIDIVIIYYYLFFVFSWQVKIHYTYNTKDIK